MSAKMASSEIFPNIILASSGDIGGPREEADKESDAVEIQDEDLSCRALSMYCLLDLINMW